MAAHAPQSAANGSIALGQQRIAVSEQQSLQDRKIEQQVGERRKRRLASAAHVAANTIFHSTVGRGRPLVIVGDGGKTAVGSSGTTPAARIESHFSMSIELMEKWTSQSCYGRGHQLDIVRRKDFTANVAEKDKEKPTTNPRHGRLRVCRSCRASSGLWTMDRDTNAAISIARLGVHRLFASADDRDTVHGRPEPFFSGKFKAPCHVELEEGELPLSQFDAAVRVARINARAARAARAARRADADGAVAPTPMQVDHSIGRQIGAAANAGVAVAVAAVAAVAVSTSSTDSPPASAARLVDSDSWSSSDEDADRDDKLDRADGRLKRRRRESRAVESVESVDARNLPPPLLPRVIPPLHFDEPEEVDLDILD